VLRQVATSTVSPLVNDPKHLSFLRLVVAETGRFPNLAQLIIRNGTQPGIQTISRYLAEHSELKRRLIAQVMGFNVYLVNELPAHHKPS
jgi:hypothetical protein